MPLENTLWVLVSFAEHGESLAMVPGSQITAFFDADQGRIAGSAGCNRYFGGFEVRGGIVAVSRLANTRMMCDGPIMEQETRYLAALEATRSYEIEGGRLQLHCSGGRVLSFRAVRAPLNSG